MPSETGTNSIAANATESDLLQNKLYEFVPFNAIVTWGLQGSATGLLADIKVGTRIVASQMTLRVQDRIPNRDDMQDWFIARAGERILMTVTNTTGGALNAHHRFDFNPVR